MKRFMVVKKRGNPEAIILAQDLTEAERIANVKHPSWVDIVERKYIPEEIPAWQSAYDRYLKYITALDEEFLAYEYNDRGLDDRRFHSRETMIVSLSEWALFNFLKDPTWIPDLEYINA